MKEFVASAHTARLDLGMTQARLAVRAEVSFETAVLTPAVLTPAVLTPAVLTPAVLILDWEALIAHGLPLTSAGSGIVQPTALTLRPLLACGIAAWQHKTSMDARQREALHALLLALAHGYPSLFSAWFRRSSQASAVVAVAPSGRVIKLKRIAERTLSGYL